LLPPVGTDLERPAEGERFFGGDGDLARFEDEAATVARARDLEREVSSEANMPGERPRAMVINHWPG